MTAATLARRSLRVAARAQRRVVRRDLAVLYYRTHRGESASCLALAALWRRDGYAQHAMGCLRAARNCRLRALATLPA